MVLPTDDSAIFYFQICVTLLLCISELLGMSSCEYNGVLHFIFLFCHRRIHLDCFVEKEEEKIEMENSERKDSISDSFHSLPLNA